MELTDAMKGVLEAGACALKGSERRVFMARTVAALGTGGQRRAQRELGWNRGTIRKGARELRSGFACADAFHWRGRKRAEERAPSLMADIRGIVEGQSAADPTFRTSRLYTRLSAGEVRRQLIERKLYRDEDLPTERTIRTKLNDLGFHPRMVAKSKPKKSSRRQTPSSTRSIG